jgi:NADH-quinone oxidoreductase subunit N
MLIAGFSFKLAAVPLHFYAGDVYEGAATPVTAFLSFVPKAAGLIALLAILRAIGQAPEGGAWQLPPTVFKLLWIVAVLTMCAGNVLGLLQFNVKRMFAYSSIAHSGYMLVGVTVLAGAYTTVGAEHAQAVQQLALEGVLFYLAAYGIMNAGAFGVLMMIPARDDRPATSAETFDDLAGQGRRHVGLGLAMAVCCFSLIGLPLTVGFLGKVYLIKPALSSNLTGLVIIMVINAAVSAGYYLRIVATMFLKNEPVPLDAQAPATLPRIRSWPVMTAIVLSVAGTLAFGIVLPLAEGLSERAGAAWNTGTVATPVVPDASPLAVAK